MKFFLFTIQFFFLIRLTLQDDSEESQKGTILDNPIYFSNEICSYNIVNSTDTEKKKIICSCLPQYADDPNIRKINGHTVYCSYPRKRRMIALTLAVCVPFGADYFYLGYIIIPVCIIVVALFIIIVNCRFFLKKEEIERENSDNGIIVDYKADKKQMCYLWLHLSLVIGYLIWYIIDIILQSLGVIKDANGYELYNDLQFYK